MSRRAITLVLAFALLLVGPSLADAGKKKKKRLNMPAGWSWPATAAMKKSGKRCLARLDTLGVRWKKARPARKVLTPITLPTMEIRGVELASIWRKPPFVMDCYLALAIAEVAPALREQGVRALRFTTIHQYRHVRKNKRIYKKILSRHSLGLAMDVFEVELDDGTVIVVKDSYKRGDRTLRAIEEAANQAGVFRALLTPGNDPRSHHDHFHIEAALPLP